MEALRLPVHAIFEISNLAKNLVQLCRRLRRVYKSGTSNFQSCYDNFDCKAAPNFSEITNLESQISTQCIAGAVWEDGIFILEDWPKFKKLQKSQSDEAFSNASRVVTV